MCTDWVEIAEDDGDEVGIRFSVIFEYLFDHGFSLSVWIGRHSAVFLDANLLAVAVDASTAGKDDFIAFELVHHLEEVYCPCNVVIIVFEGLADGLPDCLEASEVNDGGGLELREYLVDLLYLLEVHIHILDVLLARDLLQSIEALELRVVQVVQDQHVVALLDQFYHRVRPNVPKAPGHQDFILR